jgi:nucleoside phosphorylase
MPTNNQRIDMKNIIVITPTESESVFLVERGIRVFNCGVGPAECGAATAKLIVENKPDLMILAGTAGTYSENLEIGETVVVKSETTAALGRLSETDHVFTPLFQKTYLASVVPKGYKTVRSNTVPTAGGIISSPVEADIENMEGAPFFAVCAAFGIPAMEVRTVSNKVGESISKSNMEISVHRLSIELEAILASLT